jgi:sigma-B regulation protein RsbU (phosphoserine phosphatase)
MTAWGSVELAVDAIRRGGHDFVQKPWDNQRLLETIRRNLAKDPTLQTADSRHRREIQEAHEVQRRLLPLNLPRLDGYRIHGSWQPARGVGGDYFDAIRLGDSKVAFCIADVSGEGLPAALLMANVQAAVRACARISESPAEICRRVNRIVLENTRSEKFVTFFFGTLDAGTRRLRYANAGHPPSVLLGPDASMRRLTDGGSVLGVFADAGFEESEVTLTPGSRAVFFTDWLTEAANADREEFGERRFVELLRDLHDKPDIDLHQAVLDSVRAFAGEFQDDATILTITADPVAN